MLLSLLAQQMSGMLLQSGGQMAGARFLKHNIRDDFDDLTDVAQAVRHPRCALFCVLHRRRTGMMPSLAIVLSPCMPFSYMLLQMPCA